MSKTNFSGPVKVGTNTNNTGWIVNAVSDVYDAGVNEGTAETKGTVLRSNMRIPRNSQIVDVCINVEVGFNNPMTGLFTAAVANDRTVTKDSGDLAGIDVGTGTGGSFVDGAATVTAISGSAPWTVTFSHDTTGSTSSGQSVTFSSGKYLNVGTTSGVHVKNIIDHRLLTFSKHASYTGVLLPKNSADTTGGWDDIQGSAATAPSRSIYFGFEDYAPVKSDRGRVRVTIFYAQARNLI